MDCPEQSDMSLLAGTRILSIEQFGAAPYGSMFLAAFPETQTLR